MTKFLYMIPPLALAMIATGCDQTGSPDNSAEEPPAEDVTSEVADQEKAIKDWCSIIGEVGLRDENLEYKDYDYEAGRTVINVYSPALQEDNQIICEHSGEQIYTAYADGLPVDDTVLRPYRVDVDDVSLDTVVIRAKGEPAEDASLTDFYIYATLTGLEPGPSYCVAIDYKSETTTSDSMFMSVDGRPMEIVNLPITTERATYLATKPIFAIDPDENGEAVLRLKSREPASLYDLAVTRCTGASSTPPTEEADAGPEETGEPSED